MKRDLGDGYELDDDRERVDCEAVHRYLSEESYWVQGRTRDAQSYLADVYVLEEHRSRGLGVELVRFRVDEGTYAATKWFLHTSDAHDLYRKFGFAEPGDKVLERWSRKG